MKDTKKLKGITKVSLQQPRQLPTPATTSTSKKGKDDDDDKDSEETNLGDDPDKLQSFFESIKSYGVLQLDLNKINFKGGGITRKAQYPLLQQIAKELYQKRNSEQFLNKTTDQISGGRNKIKSIDELNKALEILKKKN